MINENENLTADSAALAAMLPPPGFFARARASIIPSQAILQWVLPRGSVLDIGCGSGVLSHLIKRRYPVVSIVGFDPNRKAIEKAKKTLVNSALQFFDLEGFEQGPSQQQFDTVMLIDVLHHIPPQDHRSFMARASNWVKPGGRLVYKDMCTRPFWRASANQMHDFVLARQWVHHVPFDFAKQVFEESGLTLIHESYHSILWYGHELAAFEKPIRS